MSLTTLDLIKCFIMNTYFYKRKHTDLFALVYKVTVHKHFKKKLHSSYLPSIRNLNLLLITDQYADMVDLICQAGGFVDQLDFQFGGTAHYAVISKREIGNQNIMIEFITYRAHILSFCYLLFPNNY